MQLKTFRNLFFYGVFLVTAASAQVEYLAGQIIQEINPLMEQMIVGGNLDEEQLALALDDATVKLFRKTENIEHLLELAQLNDELTAIKGSPTFRVELVKLIKANQEKVIQALNRVLSESTINYSKYVFLPKVSGFHPLAALVIRPFKIGDKNPHYNSAYVNLDNVEKYKLQESLKRFVNAKFASVFSNHSVSLDHSRISYYVSHIKVYKKSVSADFPSIMRLINFLK